MSSFKISAFDGKRLRGCYVYMLICRDDGPLYIKVGISETPTERLMALRLGCPVNPKTFAVCESFSRRMARKIEVDLHKALKQWRAHGEWFKLDISEKDAFNDAIRPVFSKHTRASWPLRWEKVSVKAMVSYWNRRKATAMKKLRRRGRAYADFKKDVAITR